MKPPPERHWRSYGTAPLPTPAETLQQPMRAFPSWFLKITSDRCGKDTMLNEAHMTEHQRGIVLRAFISTMRHDRLRRQGRAGGIAHRHRRRPEPAGAAHRAAGGVSRWMLHISRHCQPWLAQS